jgi:hypothetical protein
MIKTALGWTLMFRVSTREKADKALAHANELLDGKLNLQNPSAIGKFPSSGFASAPRRSKPRP